MELNRTALRLKIAVRALALLLCFSLAGKAHALAVGSQAPDITLPKLNGAQFSLSSLRGKPVILTFFTTWSDSCAENLKFLSSHGKSLKGAGIVTVAFENKPETVSGFLKKHDIDLLTLIDAKKTSIRDFRILIIPMTFLIDADGIVDKVYVDFDEAVMESITEDVKRLLSQKS